MPRSAGEFLSDMHQSQHFGMLSHMMNMGQSSAPEALAGGLMSRGMAVGRPMMSGIAGMVGLDPMSLGLRAGMGAFNAGAGVLGAGMAGMGVAAGAGIVGAGVAFAGNQMMSGAQQQMQLNQNLRGFNFQNHQGGMGFTSNQGFQIGGAMRGMTHELGQSGETTSFSELSKLASNMGRMGMAQGVRTVGEFKDKFKEMIDTLKKVSHDMGTSLEEAQKFVNSMKGSGIFRTADQLKMSTGTRMTALAGGVAMSEVTGMANIGSQISRSVGGLGRQGAFAGMKTIEQIGMAQKVGALSEEDIYNATGMTGAEGRQALGTAQLQQSAQFLSGGRGRRFLASIAGKDGRIDEGSAMEYLMGGGVGTGRTMEMANKNLSGVGRANFIRNEGRLRGAALEKFGGLAQSMVYQQWLSQRGYDPSSMDDKSMLAFQRFSGMGRDEADVAMKQINGIPDMMREMQKTEGMAASSDRLSHQKNTRGLEGLKRKFEHTKESIQGKLQQAGADILRAGSSTIEKWFNETMDVYESSAISDIHEVMSTIALGGAQGSKLFEDTFGRTNKGGGLGGAKGSNNGLQNMQFAAMTGSRDKMVDSFGKSNGNSIKEFTMAGSGQSGTQRLSSFGSALEAAAKTDPKFKDMADKFTKASPTEKAAMMQTLQEGAGVGKDSQLLTALDAEQKKASLNAGQDGAFHTEADAEAALGRLIVGESTTQGGRKRSKGETVGQIAIGGVTGLAGAGLGLAKDAGNFLGAGAALAGAGYHTIFGSGDDIKNDLEAAKNMAMKGLSHEGAIAGFKKGAELGDDKAYELFGDKKKHQGVAQALKDPKTRTAAMRMLSGSATEEDRSAAGTEILKLKELGSKRSAEDEGKFELLGNAYIGSKHADVMARIGRGEQVSKEDLAKLSGDYKNVMGKDLDTSNMNSESMMKLRAVMVMGKEATIKQQEENRAKATGLMRDEISDQRARLMSMGIATMDPKTNKLVLRGGTEGMSDAQKKAMDAALGLANTELDPNSKQDQLSEYQEKGKAKFMASVSDMSLADKQAFAKKFAGTSYGMESAISAKREQSLSGLEKRFGKTGAAARMMGLDIDKDVLDNISKMPGGKPGEEGPDKAKALLLAGGLKESDLKDMDPAKLKDLNKALNEQKVGKRADGISNFMAGNPEIREKLQANKASQDDPSYRALEKIRDAAVKQEGYLKIIASKSLDGTALADAIAKVAGGAEGGGKAPPGAAGGK